MGVFFMLREYMNRVVFFQTPAEPLHPILSYAIYFLSHPEYNFGPVYSAYDLYAI